MLFENTNEINSFLFWSKFILVGLCIYLFVKNRLLTDDNEQAKALLKKTEQRLEHA